MVQKQHFSLRLSAGTLDRLERRAAASGRTKSAVAEQYLEEGMRIDDHPGILFYDGPWGRYPGLIGHRINVRHVVETYLAEGCDRQATIDYFQINPALIHAALDYYADYKEEVDAWIGAERRYADEAEAVWRRRQGVGAGTS